MSGAAGVLGKNVLPAITEATGQARGQPCLFHLPLSGLDIILYPMVMDDAGLLVKEGIAGAWIAVPGLPYSATVYDEAVLFLLEVQLTGEWADLTDVVLVKLEDQGDM